MARSHGTPEPTKLSCNFTSIRLSKSDFHCAVKMSGQKNLRMEMCQKGYKTQKKCVKLSKIRFNSGGGKSRYYSKGAGKKIILSLES